jgi:hypothetical protein
MENPAKSSLSESESQQRNTMNKWIGMAGMMLLCACAVQAEEKMLSVAVFPFETGAGLETRTGVEAAQMISVLLSAQPNLMMVERAELEKVLGEQALSMSGAFSQNNMVEAGHLLGAQVLVTGRVFLSGGKRYCVAKVIGTETSRVYGEMIQSDPEAALDKTVDEMAKKLAVTITGKGETLVAKVETEADWLKRMGESLKGKNLPSVSAAETEIKLLLGKLGFQVLAKDAVVEILGEAFSEFGMRKGEMVSCRARVEIKAKDQRQEKVEWVDRETTGAIDLSEHVAAKSALQRAGLRLAERIALKATGVSK